MITLLINTIFFDTTDDDNHKVVGTTSLIHQTDPHDATRIKHNAESHNDRQRREWVAFRSIIEVTELSDSNE